MSGLAFVSMIGVAELITHSGGFVKKRSEDSAIPGNSQLADRSGAKKRKRKRRRKSRKNKRKRQQQERKRRRKRPTGMLMSEREKYDYSDENDLDYLTGQDYSVMEEPSSSYQYSPAEYVDNYDYETTTETTGNDGKVFDRRFLYSYPDRSRFRTRRWRHRNDKRKRKIGQATLDRFENRFDDRSTTDYVETNYNEFPEEFEDVPDIPDFEFDFTPINYDNYDRDEDGNIDMTKPKKSPSKFSKETSSKTPPSYMTLQPSNQVNRIYVNRADSYSTKFKRNSEDVLFQSDKRPRDDPSDYVYVDAGSFDFKDFAKRRQGGDFTPLDYDNYDVDQG